MFGGWGGAGNWAKWVIIQVKWNGEYYALRQFDVGEDGTERFENELKTYIRAERVWGRPVANHDFLSESVSGGVKLLGLHLGSKIDDSFIEREFMESGKRLTRRLSVILGLDTTREEFHPD